MSKDGCVNCYPGSSKHFESGDCFENFSPECETIILNDFYNFEEENFYPPEELHNSLCFGESEELCKVHSLIIPKRGGEEIDPEAPLKIDFHDVLGCSQCHPGFRQILGDVCNRDKLFLDHRPFAGNSIFYETSSYICEEGEVDPNCREYRDGVCQFCHHGYGLAHGENPICVEIETCEDEYYNSSKQLNDKLLDMYQFIFDDISCHKCDGGYKPFVFKNHDLSNQGFVFEHSDDNIVGVEAYVYNAESPDDLSEPNVTCVPNNAFPNLNRV